MHDIAPMVRDKANFFFAKAGSAGQRLCNRCCPGGCVVRGGRPGLVEQGAAEVEFDLDFLVDVDHEGAGIFEAPLYVGHDEGTYGMDLVAADLDLHGDVDLMRRAEEGEEAVDLEG